MLIIACVAVLIVWEFRKAGPPAISGQQAVDMGLSLQPSLNAGSTVSTQVSSSASSSTPAAPPLYNGCRLTLDFIVTRGDPRAAGGVGYVLVAKDAGTVTCRSASISVYYAADENYDSALPAPTDGYYWQLGDIAPGGEIDIALATTRAAPLAGAAVTNEACLSAGNGADACSNSLAASSATAAPASAPAAVSADVLPLTPGEEAGVWEWTPADQMSTVQMQDAVNAAAVNKFNVIYLTVDDYLAASDTAGYERSVGSFIALAAQKGIAVDAEAGWRDWAQPQNAGNAGRIAAWVAAYNAAHAQKFRGVQFDIEPYLLPQYANDEGDVLTQEVVLIDQLVQQDKTLGLPLAIVIPHFYDEGEGWTPEITVDGVLDYPYRQILRLLNELPPGNGRIIEMAYRNFASGSDSAIALSQQEVNDADGTNVKVVIAQETGPVSPSYVTFAGTSRAQLFAQIAAINGAFASDTAFQGVAIDYLDPYLQLQ
jgi:hypothetical protein